MKKVSIQNFDQKFVNMHTHTGYCAHAKPGLPEEYVGCARESGLKVLGFSEHCVWPDHAWEDYYQTFEVFDTYAKDVRRLQKEEAEKEDGIKIFLGAECDWRPKYTDYIKEHILGELGFDYILGSVHFVFDNLGFPQQCSRMPDFPKYLSQYVDRYVNMIESGLCLFGCHPDVYSLGYKTNKKDANVVAAAKDIIQCAVEHDFVLEVNGAGRRRGPMMTPDGNRYVYTTEEFWNLAVPAGVKCTCNSDAHSPELVHGKPVDGYINECYEFADKMGIKYVSWDVATDDLTGKTSVSIRK